MTKNQETIDEIMRLRESGMKVQEIADHFGVSKIRIYQIAGDELKAWYEAHAPEPKEVVKKKSDIRSIRKMMREGKSINEIADYYGVSRQAIYAKVRNDELRKNGLANLNNFALGTDSPNHRIVDPETGLVVENQGINSKIIGKIGDEKVSAFVQYHMEMLAMRQGVDKHDVNELYNRFIRYLQYCQEHTIVPNNMNAYFAIGVDKGDIYRWSLGKGTPEHKQFANDLKAFFASVHEQGATDGVLNPISAMFWQKAHDGIVEANKLEVVTDDPLGEKRSASDIAKAYEEVELPD